MAQIIEIILLLVIIALLLFRRTQTLQKPKSSHSMILDSSALIDGRIIELSNSGFIPEELIVPEFILHELQLLADNSDSYKRERARFGLDVVKELQGGRYASVVIDPSLMQEKMPTDDKLLTLAKKLNAPIYTTDFNLNKVADIQQIKVMNVNELAQQLRPAVLPGERQTIKIIQRGSNPNQGVGYLEDGTMVVVDGAAKLIGSNIEAEIARTFQTVAGKMLFARLVSPKANDHKRDHRSH